MRTEAEHPSLPFIQLAVPYNSCRLRTSKTYKASLTERKHLGNVARTSATALNAPQNTEFPTYIEYTPPLTANKIPDIPVRFSSFSHARIAMKFTHGTVTTLHYQLPVPDTG